MPSMMDHVADVGRGGVELRRLAQQYEFPDFVKQASPELSLQVPPGTAVTTCADVRNKQFWCHTKAACWLSHLFYTEKRAEFHPKDRALIEKRLDEFARYHAIKAACDVIAARWAELHKTAEAQLPDSSFAYVWTGENGQKVRHLPLRSAQEVKAAAEYVRQYRDSFPYPVRRFMADKILLKAASYGANVKDESEFLERQAGRGVCDPAKVVAMIEKRASLVPADLGTVVDEETGKRSGGLKEQFLKMARTIKDMPRQALQPAMLTKLAETIDRLDRNMGLTANYSGGLPRPEDVIFEATFTKSASAVKAHVATTTGTVYDKVAFAKIALDDVRGLFGEEFADRVKTPLGDVDPEKMAEEVATLPRPDAQMLDGLMSDNGLTPQMRKAASAPHGFSPAEMAAIAKHYG